MDLFNDGRSSKLKAIFILTVLGTHDFKTLVNGWPSTIWTTISSFFDGEVRKQFFYYITMQIEEQDVMITQRIGSVEAKYLQFDVFQ